MVVVARIVRAGRTEIIVAPVTHSAPDRPDGAVEMPKRVKQALGLDEARSWVVTSELNCFIWPGPDIRVAPGRETPVYDAIPEILFNQVREALAKQVAAGRLRITKRDE